jgi:hypothetical protein
MKPTGAMLDEAVQQRTRNLRTGLILALVAVAFLLGFLLRRFYQ